jgi:hypothetical protein
MIQLETWAHYEPACGFGQRKAARQPGAKGRSKEFFDELASGFGSQTRQGRFRIG